MSTLRKALGTGPADDFIETVARAGYRLAVPVRVAVGGRSAATSRQRAADRPKPRPLAVRPFSTGDLAEADTYLGVGIADAVTTVLGGVPGLTVSPVGAVEDLAGARVARRWSTCWRARCSATPSGCTSRRA